MALMDEGKNLVIAPEGTRSRTGALIEASRAVSYLATRLGQPSSPVAIAGTEDKVIFGNLKRAAGASHTLCSRQVRPSACPLPDRIAMRF